MKSQHSPTLLPKYDSLASISMLAFQIENSFSENSSKYSNISLSLSSEKESNITHFREQILYHGLATEIEYQEEKGRVGHKSLFINNNGDVSHNKVHPSIVVVKLFLAGDR